MHDRLDRHRSRAARLESAHSTRAYDASNCHPMAATTKCLAKSNNSRRGNHPLADSGIPKLERRQQNPLDIDPEAFAVDRAVKDEGGGDAVMTKRRHEGHRSPVPMWDFGVERQAAAIPAMASRHVGLGPGLVDKDQPRGFYPRLIFLPPQAPSHDIRAIPLSSVHGFF